MSGKIVKYAAVVLVVGAFAVGGFLFFGRSDQNPAETYLTAQVRRGPIERTISATGTLRAVVTVQVGSQVSGRIQELHADYNSAVKKGQTLAVIDPSNLEAQRERASASLATAQAALKSSVAGIANREAELVSARANREALRVSQLEALRELKRMQGLFADRLITQQALEQQQSAVDQSQARLGQGEAQVSQAEAAIHTAEAQREQAEANVSQARAELQLAEVNLRYTRITSPIDGVVIERNVDIGQTVAASFQAPTLFLIANDLSRMQVTAQVDEADIGVVSEQARVDFTVDAFPGEVFHGKITEIRLTGTSGSGTSATGTSATGSSNVVVYDVIIDVENPRLQLRPGMTATVSLTVARLDDVLKVPNTALRFRPANRDREALEGRAAGSLLGGRPEAPGRGDSSDQGSSIQPVLAASGEQYGIQAGLKLHFPEAEAFTPTWGVVWVPDARGQPEQRRVQLGITDGRETAVLEGRLAEGDTVITQELGAESTPQATASPFGIPRMRRR